MPENDFVSYLRQRFATDDESVLVGCGPDDCAHIDPEYLQGLAVSIDSFVEGVHFTPDTPPSLVAAKAMGASLSDLAASACWPRYILVSACLRHGLGKDWAKDFADSLADIAKRQGAAIVGGDTTSSAKSTFITVCVLGEPMTRGPVTRSGAAPGDALVVTGSLGGSLLGRHLKPEPRFREMNALLDYVDGGRVLGAAMDISDGLALDLSRLATESGVGAVIEADLVPVSDDARRMAETSGRTPLDHALSDGEDFELLLAVDPGFWPEFLNHNRKNPYKSQVPFTRIGWFTEGSELLIQDAAGKKQALRPEGYIHKW